MEAVIPTPDPNSSKSDKNFDEPLIEKMNIRDLKKLMFDFKSELSVDNYSEVTLDTVQKYLYPKYINISELKKFWTGIEENAGKSLKVSDVFVFLSSHTIDSLDNKLIFCASLFESENSSLEYESVAELLQSISHLDPTSGQKSTNQDQSAAEIKSRRRSLLSKGFSTKTLLFSDSIYSTINMRLRANSVVNVNPDHSLDLLNAAEDSKAEDDFDTEEFG